MIKINNTEYANAIWGIHDGVATLEFVSEKTLAELAEEFALGVGTTIEEYDGSNLISKWYFKEFASIGYQKSNGKWKVHVTIYVSEMPINKEQEMTVLFETQDRAISELAELVSQIEILTNNNHDHLNGLQGVSNTRFESMDLRINQIQNSCSDLNQRFNMIINRIANLENYLSVRGYVRRD